MANFKFKRCSAYLIDLFIVSLLVMMIGQIEFLNPNLDKYQEVVNEYSEYYESNFGNVTTIETEDLINKEYAGYMYDLNYYALSNTVIEIVVILLYFTLFPKFNNNQTIGKRLFKIKVVSVDKEEVSIWKHFVRALLIPIFANVILYNVITAVLNIITLFVFKDIIYLYVNLGITYLLNIYCYADVITMLIRKDNRSIRDLICRTKVIETC